VRGLAAVAAERHRVGQVAQHHDVRDLRRVDGQQRGVAGAADRAFFSSTIALSATLMPDLVKLLTMRMSTG